MSKLLTRYLWALVHPSTWSRDYRYNRLIEREVTKLLDMGCTFEDVQVASARFGRYRLFYLGYPRCAYTPSVARHLGMPSRYTCYRLNKLLEQTMSK